jgi:hypothetical protein
MSAFRARQLVNVFRGSRTETSNFRRERERCETELIPSEMMGYRHDTGTISSTRTTLLIQVAPSYLRPQSIHSLLLLKRNGFAFCFDENDAKQQSRPDWASIERWEIPAVVLYCMVGDPKKRKICTCSSS